MHVARNQRSGLLEDEYHFCGLTETLAMHLVMGIKERIKKYEADLRNPEYVGEEDQVFLRGEISSMKHFVYLTEEYFTITETGFEIHR